MNMAAGASAKFELSVSLAAVIVAAVIAFATILISAYIPGPGAPRGCPPSKPSGRPAT